MATPIETPDKSGEEQAPQAGGAEETRQPSWRPLIIGLLIAMVMASIMATTYIAANHAVVAHKPPDHPVTLQRLRVPASWAYDGGGGRVGNLPWGQVGSSPLTTEVEKSIDLKVYQYASQPDLEQAANESKIYGGFVAQTNIGDHLGGGEPVGSRDHARLPEGREK